MSIRVLLATLDQDTRTYHEKMLLHHGVDFDTVTSRDFLLDHFSEQKYNGVLLDDEFTKQSDPHALAAIEDMVHTFPFLKIKKFFSAEEWSRDWQYFSKLDYFINHACKAFSPRLLRIYKRVPLHLNVVLSQDISFNNKRSLKTVTLNVSEGGCFIMLAEPWVYGPSPSFIIKEIDENEPVQGEIRWQIEWGKAMCIPGLGIRFNSIDQKKKSRLSALVTNYENLHKNS